MVMQVAERPAGQRPYRALGQRIATARRAAHRTQWELAELVGISKSYPGVIERGENRPDPDILRRIARVLGIDYNELAELAGYLPTSHGDETIQAPEDVAPYIRRLLHYPAEVWAALEQTAGAWTLHRPHHDPEDEPKDETDPDRPE